MLLSILGVNANLVSNCQCTGQVALTFDDGPSSYTVEIMKILRKKQISGSFHFNPGHTNDTSRSLIAQVHKDKHDVGLRTNSKRDYFSSNVKEKEIHGDLKQQVDYINGITKSKMKFARSPVDGNVVNKTVFDFFKDRDIIQVGCGFSPYDTQLPVEKAVKEHLETISPSFDSEIITLYESRLGEDKALPNIIDMITKKGFKIVPLSTCLKGYDPKKANLTFGSKGRKANGVESYISDAYLALMVYLVL